MKGGKCLKFILKEFLFRLGYLGILYYYKNIESFGFEFFPLFPSRSFQFLLLHRQITTNKFAHKIGIAESANCTFCKKYEENLIHLFMSESMSGLFGKMLNYF